jgi:GAF domain-containing protein
VATRTSDSLAFVRAATHVRRVPLTAEVPLAFAAGLVTFASVSVVLAAADSTVAVVILGAIALAAVVEAVRELGVTFAVAIAIAVVLAYDWFEVPPTHAHEFPDARNLAELLTFVAAAVLVGSLAARAGRRADTSDIAFSVLADEQAALRRVATLVAQRVRAEDLFAAMVRELGQLLGVDLIHMARFERNVGTVVAAWSRAGDHAGVGTQVPVDDDSVGAIVSRSGRPARRDSYDDATGFAASMARDIGVRSAVAAPIVVDGRLWGVTIVSSKEVQPMPPDTEARITAFTDLAATAISNTEAWAESTALADEQAALHRVATLVAHGGAPSELFAAVAREVGTLLGGDLAGIARFDGDWVAGMGAWAADGEHPPYPERWPMHPQDPAGMIAATHRSVTIDDWTDVPGPMAELMRDRWGSRSAVGTPIVVNGRLWGALALHSKQVAAFPAGTEERMAQFTDLIATAVANAAARAEVVRLAEEQAGLRRVATLVAQQASQEEVFTAIAEEIAANLPSDHGRAVRMMRFDDADGGTALVLAAWGDLDTATVPGMRLALGGRNVITRVYETRAAVRMDDHEATGSGDITEKVRGLGIDSIAGAPITVEGRLWGSIGAASRETLPADTEQALGRFTDLLATAIANTEARRHIELLAAEHASLRRVATLVAEEAVPDEVLRVVAEEVAALVDAADCAIWRDERDGTATLVAVHGARNPRAFSVGDRLATDGDALAATVLREQRPVRVEDYAPTSGAIAERARVLGIRKAVGCPIVVRGRIWGAIVVVRYVRDPLQTDAEGRLAQFADLIATAVANAAARTEVERLAGEQAGLRRVATLAAEGASATAVFDAVAAEIGTLLDSPGTVVCRYDSASEITVMAHRGEGPEPAPGTQLTLGAESVDELVRRTQRSARIEGGELGQGELAALARGVNAHTLVASPIIVDGRLWGFVASGWREDHVPPPDTEQRMTEFAQLLGVAIVNADSRDQLIASRARLVATADDARRRVVRDLHDGAQQRLLHTVITLKLAQRALNDDDAKAGALVGDALEHAELGYDELRELAHGILPPALTRGGLRAGISFVVDRLAVPVAVDVPRDRFPAEVEASGYFVVAEALTNVVKHAQATSAAVNAAVAGAALRIEVCDDGVGGADADGHGLLGINDRVAALGGRLEIDSPVGGGTRLVVTLPV